MQIKTHNINLSKKTQTQNQQKLLFNNYDVAVIKTCKDKMVMEVIFVIWAII